MAASTLGRQWIADLQNREIERTGIKSLKIKYNAVFGYFIEITKANVGSVPPDYHRKQTTVNGERYITEELKILEATMDENGFSMVNVLPFNNNDFNFAHPSISPDGFTIYFASDMEGGKGGGEILFTGTPEELVKSKKGYTAPFLKKEL